MTPDDEKRIDIIIPVYNEAENILPVLQAFDREVHSPIRILICYDRDDDNTLPVLQKADSRFEICLVKNKKQSVHGAVVTGFEFSAAPAVITYMADDDYNAPLIDRMAEMFWQGSEIVCPSRLVRGGSMAGCPQPRRAVYRLASFCLHNLAGLPVQDATNAFRLFSRRLLRQVRIESTRGFSYSFELLAKCHRLGWKVGEIPAQWPIRRQGKSRFRTLAWFPDYLRWFVYVVATGFLRLVKRSTR